MSSPGCFSKGVILAALKPDEKHSSLNERLAKCAMMCENILLQDLRRDVGM